MKNNDLEYTYEQVIEKIKEIEEQCNSMKKTYVVKCYDVNIDEMNMFSGLKIVFLRDKNISLKEIENEIKIFLSNLNFSKNEYLNMEEKIKQVIEYLCENTYLEGSERILKLSDIKLIDFFERIRVSIDTLAADNMMLKEIEDLENEYNSLKKIKLEYENNNNRQKSRKKRFKLLDFPIF